MRIFAREAPAVLLLVLGCAGGGDAARRDVDALRAEVRALQRDNAELGRKVDSLSGRVELLSARARAPERQEPPAPAAPIVPPDLAVVRVEPPLAAARDELPARVLVRDEPPVRVPVRADPPVRGRTAPPVPTAVPIAEPDAEGLEELSRPGHREITAMADEELRRARKLDGASRAHALEDFVGRYPRHPSADNALVEASAAYADAGREEAACDLARRACADYPAGDALSDALERLASCEARRGASGAERRLLERLVNEFPRTPAGARAGARLANISGQRGETPPPDPARSGP